MRWQRLSGLVTWSLILAAHVAAVWATGLSPAKLRDLGNMAEFVRGMFPPAWDVLPDVLRAMGDTLAIALLGTSLAFVVAFPLSFLAARNIGPRWAGAAVRGLLAFLRSVPEVLWAVLFVVATELGDVPGVLALAVHNLGILGKQIGEIFEAAPSRTVEAVAATGAPPATVFWYGVLPWALPHVLSQVFFRFECNIRTATILGLVGAGGIGRELMIHRQLFNYPAMLVDTLGILALVVAADALGALVRRRVT